jgi:hypothetical protein
MKSKSFSCLLSVIAAFCLIPVVAHGGVSDSPNFNAGIEIQVPGDTVYVCLGTSIQLIVTGGTDYQWTPAGDFDNAQNDTVTLTPSASQWYFVEGIVADSTCVDSVFALLIEPDVEIITSDPIRICPEDEVQVTLEADYPITSVSWMPETSVSDPNSVVPILSPDTTTEYVATVTIGTCDVTDTIVIDVVPFSFTLNTPDTVFICVGEKATMQTTLSPDTANLVWEPLDSTIVILPGTGLAEVNPTVSTTYTATASYDICEKAIPVFVRVDSLPTDLEIDIIPEKDMYCQGEVVTLISPMYTLLHFPDITHQWEPANMIDTDPTNLNIGVTLQDTTLFQRLTINNACRDTNELLVNVIPFNIPLSVNDTTLCPGESFTV